MAATFALLAGCGGDDAVEPTATSAIAVTSTAHATEPLATNTTAATEPARTSTPGTTVPGVTPLPGLPGDIVAAIVAAMRMDRAGLETLLVATEGPCVVNPPPAILRAPPCPDGVAAGSVAPALVIGGCPDAVGFIDAAITYRVAEFAPGGPLIGVMEIAGGPLRYAALFGYERVTWLGFDDQGKLIGAGGGGDCPAFEYRPRITGARWLTGPDWPD